MLDLLLRLYRGAYETPLGDFDDLALSMIGMAVPFCAAVWLVGAIDRGTLRLLRAHLYGLMPDALRSFITPNPQLSRALIVAAADAGRAYRLRVPDMGCHEGHPVALQLADGSALENQLLIADIGAPPEPASWLSLYRTRGQAQFDERDSRTASLVLPHLAQAFVLNRAVHSLEGAAPRRNAAGERSLIRADGTVLHCGARLGAMIRAEIPGWDGSALPESFLSAMRRGRLVQESETRIDVSQVGDTLVLTVKRITPAERLSPRELAVARLFGAGASYKEIARRVALAPATVRNVVQNAYRKLGVNNKAQLARLMVESD